MQCYFRNKCVLGKYANTYTIYIEVYLQTYISVPTYMYVEVCRHIEVCLYIGRSVPIKRKVRVSSGTISDSDLGGAVKLGVTDV